MALTVEQEQNLLALLDEKRIALPELTAATEVKADDLFLISQSLADKSMTAKVLKEYIVPYASIEQKGIVQLSNEIDSESEFQAATLKALVLLSDRIAPVGIPLPWPSNLLPTGYLKCNGASFDRSQYPKLAQVYPNCVLPDLRGEFIRGWSEGRGVDADRRLLSWQEDAIRDITGTLHMSGSRVSSNGVFGSAYGGSWHGDNLHWNAVCTVDFKASNCVPTAEENRPRNIAFLYIVRAA